MISIETPNTLDTGRIAGTQDSVRTVALAGGGYIVAWNTTISGNSDVAFQRFDSSGQAVGDVITANAVKTGDQMLLDAVATDDGNVTLVWSTGKTVTVRSFDGETGNATSSEVNLQAKVAAATGAQLIATADNVVKVVFSSDATGRTVLEQAVLSTAGATLQATTEIAATLTPGLSVMQIAAGQADGTQFVLMSDGTLVSTANGSKTATEAGDFLKLQSGFYVLAGEQGLNASLTGLFGITAKLASYTMGDPQVTGLTDNSAVAPDVFERRVLDLGGNRLLVIAVTDGGQNDGAVHEDGIYATVYNVNTGAYESDPQVIYGVGFLGAGGPSVLAKVDIDASVMADGRVSLSWSTANGLAGVDAFNTIIDARRGPITIDGALVTGVIHGTDELTDTVSYVNATAGVRADLALPDMNRGDAAGDLYLGIEKLIGSDFADKLRGADGGADTLLGGAGNDQIIGRSGSDTLDGQDGDDVVDGGLGQDHIFGGAGSDVLYGGLESDHIDAGTGDDFVAGGEGDDVIEGGDGNDCLSGGSGDDVIDAGAGNDVIAGDISAFGLNIIDGGDGIDTISWARGPSVFADLAYGSDVLGQMDSVWTDINDDLIVNVENLTGSLFNDYLAGDAGGNKLRGLDGADQLYGRGGADKLTGGDGEDAFIYADASEGGDTIRDFEIGVDHILLDSDGFGGINASSIVQDLQLQKYGDASGLGPKLVLQTNEPGFGNLYYDADGGLGGAKVLIASIEFTVDATTALSNFTASSFIFV